MTRDEIMALNIFQLEWEVSERLMAGNHDLRWARDLNAARLVLAEIERRGKIKPFCDAIWDMRSMDAALGVIDEKWACFTATPEQISRAALLAMEVEG